MNRRDFLKSVGFAAGTIALEGCNTNKLTRSRKVDRPNILFLMADQHRWDCLGAAGNNKIKTPNLDSIAQNGVLFSNGTRYDIDFSK